MFQLIYYGDGKKMNGCQGLVRNEGRVKSMTTKDGMREVWGMLELFCILFVVVIA